jgi:hypothetical protein
MSSEDNIKRILELSEEIYNKSMNLLKLQKIVEQLELELTDAKRNVQLQQIDINELVDMRDQLEGRKKQVQPYVSPFSVPLRDWGYHQKMTCNLCGIDLSQSMGYVCNNMNCPTFPRVTCINNSTE